MFTQFSLPPVLLWWQIPGEAAVPSVPCYSCAAFLSSTKLSSMGGGAVKAQRPWVSNFQAASPPGKAVRASCSRFTGALPLPLKNILR